MLKVVVPHTPAPNTTWVAVVTLPYAAIMGYCFPPRHADGSALDGFTLEHRHPDDVKPGNGTGLHGEKPVGHVQHNAEATYQIDKHLKSYVWRNRNGQFVRPDYTYPNLDWTSKSRKRGFDQLAFLNGDTIQSVDISYTDSMIADHLQIRSVSIGEHTLASLPYPHPNGFVVDIQESYVQYRPVSGSAYMPGVKAGDWMSLSSGQDVLEFFQQFSEFQIVSSRSSKVTSNALYLTFDSDLSSPTLRASNAMRTLSAALTQTKKLSYSNEMKSYGELTQEAAATADANSANMIAFVRDLKDVKQLIPKLKNLSSIKTHASNYLGLNYGILPTISDLESIHHALNKTHWTDNFGNQVLTAGQTVTQTHGGYHLSTIRRAKLIVSNDDSAFSQMVRKMRSSGFYPSPQNLWDLIPYSFVVDWFVDIGSFLERFDDGMRIAQLPIVACTYSDKSILDVSGVLKDVLPGFAATAEVVTYSRFVTPTPIEPPFTFDSELTAHRHVVEGGALILTRSRK